MENAWPVSTLLILENQEARFIHYSPQFQKEMTRNVFTLISFHVARGFGKVSAAGFLFRPNKEIFPDVTPLPKSLNFQAI
jgi:hypothetical protein